MKDRRQIGARHIARMRGAFRGGQARLRQPVGHSANPEADGQHRRAQARRKANVPRQTQGGGRFWDLAFHFWRRVAWSHKVSS